jgi:hypothetical protein
MWTCSGDEGLAAAKTTKAACNFMANLISTAFKILFLQMRGSLPSLLAIVVFSLAEAPLFGLERRHQGFTQRDTGTSLESYDYLVKGSREAIVETGISERYFNEHFKLISRIDRPGDMRVVWKYSLNGYEAIVNDAVGFYTAENNKRVYVHSIKNILGSTRDITTTISRLRAKKLMNSCLGNHGGGAILFISLVPREPASLYLTASTMPRPYSKRSRTRGPEKNQKNRTNRADEIESEEMEDHPPIRTGYLNLETGKCVKGEAIVAP